jgi:transposase
MDATDREQEVRGGPGSSPPRLAPNKRARTWGIRQIHIILDNLSAHKTRAVREFLEQNPRVQFHFTPTYSSWLNQVEIWFAKIERQVIARGIFTSVPDLARKLRRYINAYSANAHPIQWKHSDPSRRPHANEFTATVH